MANTKHTDHNPRTRAEPETRAVLQIVPSLDSGGAERTTIDIARALTAQGWRALVASQGGRLEPALAAAGAELIRLPVASKDPAVIFANIGRLAKIIRTRNVSLVHARSRAPAWSALFAARRTGVPFVTTYHGIYPARSGLKRLYNSIMVRGDAVIANSEWTADHIRKSYPEAASRIAVIPRGINLQAFDPASVSAERVSELRKEWNIAEGRVVLLPGRLTKWKGQLVLVEALERLKKEKRLPEDVRAVIVGDAQGRDAYVHELVTAVHDAGLGRTIAITDHVEDIPAAYLAADIVVSASTEPEAFGRVPPEAAAMGRAVIATDHGGARETVLAGKSGLRVAPNDADALANALADLLARPKDELARMGAAGRAHVLAHYTVERMCADTLALYRKLVEMPKP
ncbi:MAG TPA: glycosyltransferase family 4 protein [Micropepsaceae bacterium]|nr:glycosyltransferase family 4 protein [Micropepsaceae bacterium]